MNRALRPKKVVLGRKNDPTFLKTVPTEPLKAIVRLCSRHPYQADRLSYLPASDGSALEYWGSKNCKAAYCIRLTYTVYEVV